MYSLSLASIFLGLVGYSLCGGGHRSENQVVTLDREGLISILECARQSPGFCREFEECETLLSKPVEQAVKQCAPARFAHRRKGCYYSSHEFQAPHAPTQLFECVAEYTPELTTEEKRIQVNFEDCSRRFLKHSCPALTPYSTHGSTHRRHH